MLDIEGRLGEPQVHVAIMASEAVPFAKTGGLGDVAGALPRALRECGGVDVMLVLPLYATVDRRLLQNQIIDNLTVDLPSADGGGERHGIHVWYSEAIGAPTFLIDIPEYFARPDIYGYADDHQRYAFFCRAALALFKRLGKPLDVVHLNDWPCGFAAVELRRRRLSDTFYTQTRTLFSIHNLAYQGVFDLAEIASLGFVSAEERDSFAKDNVASALKAGLMASDALSTVSPRYALEIQTPEQGHGLDWLLRLRRERLVGIVNGVDYSAWDPANDPHIAASFNANDLAGKQLCKLDLLRRFGLPEDADRSVVAIISRLVNQKGYDLIKEAANGILETGAFFIALGTGEPEYESFLQAMQSAAPQRVGIYIGYSGEELAHQIEAGADIFLMPSLYEPCGLNQMYSMRYGTLPVVRATGGLDDTVSSFDRTRGTGNGFKFMPYTSQAMLNSLYEALYCSAEPNIWRKLQSTAMRIDHSWVAAARRYVELYRSMVTA